jgi:hypothetical protein
MERSGLRVWAAFGCAALCIMWWRAPAGAVPIDKEGDIRLGVRTYVNARIGTQNTTRSNEFTEFAGQRVQTLENLTFPYSPAGHLRQNRYFVEAELDHTLERLMKEGVGPLQLFDLLPFKITGFKYHLTFRGEYETLYDWGPKEYSTAEQYAGIRNPATGFPQPGQQESAFIAKARHNLRDIAVERYRLFQAYTEGSVGPIFVRFGRQILSWGETDGFRLLDNINPLDSSFGGFLISLDERRVPLDMLRVQYFWGNLGPFSEGFLELYGAIDNKVGFSPGTPAGSPWTLPNLGRPSATTLTQIDSPARTFSDMRGGGRLVFNVSDTTFSLAHYYTYFDTPALQVFVRPEFPVNALDPTGGQSAFGPGYSALAVQSAPAVQVTGGSATFALPSLYSIIRSELAFFNHEPRFSQQTIDPFYFHLTQPDGTDCRGPCFANRGQRPLTGGRRTGQSFNYVIGADINQFIRWLNPNQTFFISTQFFYKHLFNAVERAAAPPGPDGQPIRIPLKGEVLPVPAANVYVPRADLQQFGAVEPNFIHQPTDAFLQTLFIGTSYMGGKVNPGFTFFYDWGGSMVFQPTVTLSRDPFRFTVDYSILNAHTLKGGSGVSLLQDRDNVQFRLEYVI